MDYHTSTLRAFERMDMQYHHADMEHADRMNEYKLKLADDHERLVEAVATYLEDCGDMKEVARIVVLQAGMGDFAFAESQEIVTAATDYDAKFNGPDWKGPDELESERGADRE